MKDYPINLDLTGKQVLVVGGGKVAYQKVKRLVTTGAKITLISPKLNQQLAELIEETEINYLNRQFILADITDQFLVIAATDNQEVNQRIGSQAQENNQLVNVVDDKELSNFTLPAVVNQGGLLLTIATGGKLPALSKQIRQRLEKEFRPEYADFLDLMGQLRPVIKDEITVETKRRQIFRKLADLELIKLLSKDRQAGKAKLTKMLAEEGISIKIKNKNGDWEIKEKKSV